MYFMLSSIILIAPVWGNFYILIVIEMGLRALLTNEWKDPVDSGNICTSEVFDMWSAM